MQKFNELVDNLNGAYPLEHKKKNNSRLAPYSSQSDERFTELQSFLKYLKDWEQEVKLLPNYSREDKAAMLLSRQTLVGLEMTINSFIMCTKFLLSVGTKFIMARVFQQDDLEHYFSMQRGAVGGSRNPDQNEFRRNEQHLFIQRTLKMKRKKGNTQSQEGHQELDEAPLAKRPRKPVKRCILPLPPVPEEGT